MILGAAAIFKCTTGNRGEREAISDKTIKRIRGKDADKSWARGASSGGGFAMNHGSGSGGGLGFGGGGGAS